MSNEYAVDLLTRMLNVYSPSGNEEQISLFLADEMTKLGFKVHRDEVGNVIGEIGEGSPVVLLCGHMDTVEGEIPIRVEDGQLYGRGSVDAKGPLAAMIVAASKFADGSFPGKILVVGVVDEEGTGKGIQHFVEEGIQPDFAIFGEPSGLEKVVFGYKGILTVKVTVETPSGHSAAPWLFDNAIEKAMDFWKQINRLHMREEKLKSRFYSITSCLTGIKGGNSSASFIPSNCEILVQLRIPPQLTPEQVFEEVKRKIDRYKSTNPKVTVTLETVDVAKAFEADRRSVIVRALAWGIRKTTLNYASFSRKTGTGDMNVLGNALKIPVVTYGPGDSRLDHTPNEHIDIQEYLDSIEVLKKTLTKLPDLAKRHRPRKRTTD
ncbi:MAG TPA: M20/M25/M40 family metallo-hydrolase [Candidatus Bathyarchaeota archaeon]|nr:M20/M25/M40 family metallo-hydrolase [Candidatus Bathyarchaeota archaeon]